MKNKDFNITKAGLLMMWLISYVTNRAIFHIPTSVYIYGKETVPIEPYIARENRSFRFPTRSDTNRCVLSHDQKMARSLKFRI